MEKARLRFAKPFARPVFIFYFQIQQGPESATMLEAATMSWPELSLLTRQCHFPPKRCLYYRHIPGKPRGQASLGIFHGSGLQAPAFQPNKGTRAEGCPNVAPPEDIQTMASTHSWMEVRKMPPCAFVLLFSIVKRASLTCWWDLTHSLRDEGSLYRLGFWALSITVYCRSNDFCCLVSILGVMHSSGRLQRQMKMPHWVKLSL